MNDSTRVTRRPRRAWPPAARTAVAIIAAAALALLTVACSGGSPSSAGSGGSPSAGGSSSSPSAVAYSACMRSHGVPTFPDPGSGGAIPKGDAQDFGVSSSQLQAAQSACQPLYPNNGGSLSASLRQCEETGDCPQAMVQQVMTQLRKFSQCMRSHGVPKWPDPVLDSQGRPAVLIYLWKLGVDPDSIRSTPRWTNAGRWSTRKCRRRSWSTCPPTARAAESDGTVAPVQREAERP
jgi:hypothetical protein